MEDLRSAARAVQLRPLVAAALAVCAGCGLGASGTLGTGSGGRIVLLAAIVLVGMRWCGSGRSAATRGALLAMLLGAAVLHSAPARRPPEGTRGARTGTWREVAVVEDRSLGRVDPDPDRLAVAAGSVRDGDRVAILPGGVPSEWARGPVPGPAVLRGDRRPVRDVRADAVVRLAAGRIGAIDLAIEPLLRLRATLLARASRLRRPLTRGLVRGLLFGETSDLPEEVPDLFVRTGTYHVLAISGLQVAFVAVLLAGPLAALLATLAGGLGRVRPRAEAIRAVLLLAFVPLAGAGAPVARSALALALGGVAALFRSSRPFETPCGVPRFMPRSADPLSLWSLALLVECLVHADAPLSLSVQLSYAATLGLVLGTRPCTRALRALLPAGIRLEETGPTGRPRPAFVRALHEKLVRTVLYAVGASAAAVLATSPISWSRFGEWAPVGVLATPAIALPIAWILVAGWAWLVWPAAVPEALLDLPSRAILALLQMFDALPDSPSPLPPRPVALLVACALLAFVALRGRHGERRSRPVSRLGAALGAIVLLPWTSLPRSLEVHALDVGHGTAVVLRSPGGAVWVFDAGSRDRRGVDREALGPFLRSLEVSRLGVVLTHTDRDHDGALAWLVERYPPGAWVGAVPAHLRARLPHTSLRIDVVAGLASVPDLDRGTEHLSLEVSRGADLEGNEGSRVLEATWRGQRIVLAGDAEERGLSAWLRSRPPRPPARLLLLPHHGSDTEHLAALLRVVDPQEVWVSASGRPELAAEFDRRGLRWRATGTEGPLRLVLP